MRTTEKKLRDKKKQIKLAEEAKAKSRLKAFEELHKNDKEVYIQISDKPKTWVCKWVAKDA